MLFNEMIQKVNTLNGTGASFHYADGTHQNYFYENFPGSLGIDRASKQFSELLNAGKVKSVDYYSAEDRHPFALVGESILVHIYDHNTGKEIITRDTGKIHKVCKKNGTTGIHYGDVDTFTPLTSFASCVRFERA